MRLAGKTLLVGVAVLLVTVDPVAACRFRLFRRCCRVPCYSYCTPCQPVAGCGVPAAAPAADQDYTRSQSDHSETMKPVVPPTFKPEALPAPSLPPKPVAPAIPKPVAPQPVTPPVSPMPEKPVVPETPAVEPEEDLIPEEPAKPAAEGEMPPAQPALEEDLFNEKPADEKPAAEDDLFSEPAADAPAEDMPADEPAAEDAKPAEDSVDDLFNDSTDAVETNDAAQTVAAPSETEVDGLFEEAADEPAEVVDPMAVDETPGLDDSESSDVMPTEDETTDAAPASEPVAVERVWTDNTGKFKVTARLVVVLDDAVRLQKESGHFTTVPMRRLSNVDRQFVLGQAQLSVQAPAGKVQKF